MLGGFAMTAICALTAQNTLGVSAVVAVDPAMVAAQIDACVADIGVDAVKIGMLGSPAIAAVVADRLEALGVPIVFDPVMIATSGAALADAATIAAFERLMALATLTTPNVPELAALGGDAAMAARGVAYLAKGGDAQGPVVEDRLVVPGAPPRLWHAPRIATRHSHGTGCTLSSAIATELGRGAAWNRRWSAPAPSCAPPCWPRPAWAAGTGRWGITRCGRRTLPLHQPWCGGAAALIPRRNPVHRT
jgi:hydroxymethylpyrimidine/phosphomethylpyrimidine kinase